MQNSPRSILQTCLVALLKPVAAFCLRHSIKIQEILIALKSALVEAAEDELKKQGLPSTVSKISVMTGIHRVDISKRGEKASTDMEETSLFSRILSLWTNDKRFRKKDGTPKELDIEGKRSEFSTLVGAVTKDLNPYTALFELERTRTVERTADGKIKLRRDIYIPAGDLKRSLMLLASDMEDLVSCVEQNVFFDSPLKNVHLRTEYDNIVQEAVPQIQSWLLKETTAFHRTVHDYLKQFDKDLNRKLKDKEGGAKVGITSFGRHGGK